MSLAQYFTFFILLILIVANWITAELSYQKEFEYKHTQNLKKAHKKRIIDVILQIIVFIFAISCIT